MLTLALVLLATKELPPQSHSNQDQTSSTQMQSLPELPTQILALPKTMLKDLKKDWNLISREHSSQSVFLQCTLALEETILEEDSSGIVHST